MPLYLNALAGKGCHLVTVNDYLAKRDCAWMGAIFNFLGLKTTAIGHEQSWVYNSDVKEDFDPAEPEKLLLPISRQEAYAADVTYGTNNEFGFDYLRDNMARRVEDCVQRDLTYAIVDEVDSILIDEARTPLIISAADAESADLYRQFAVLLAPLRPEKDFIIDEKDRAVNLTPDGLKKIEAALKIENIYHPQYVRLVHHLEEALKAKALFQKNKDYVIKEGEIIIVDEFTGRLLPGRRYSEGLHQAIEAKEGVAVKEESKTLATISFQNYFRLYDKLSGMTGTAKTEEEEFYQIYGLEVILIPTNRPMIRTDSQDRIYKNHSGKMTAVVEEIKAAQRRGQPVLVGTISIERNQELSRLLKKAGIDHNILNAKHHQREARIISQAGRLKAVTVATNMAGRGVDIMLGGQPPSNKQQATNNNQHPKLKAAGKDYKKWEEERQKVLDLGGLYVIGTERHESRRIDNQLRGRSGRQGDPGRSCFFVSMDDDLMRIFGGERLKNLMGRLGLPDEQQIENRMITRSIESAQKKVEGHNFDIRKHLVEYDDVANRQRQAIYRQRRRILELGFNNQWPDWLHQEILEMMAEEEKNRYHEKIKQYKLETLKPLERAVYLQTIDILWIDHLNALANLREGIGLRGYGQRDPLVEYKQEAFRLFEALNQGIINQVKEILLNIELSPVNPPPIQPIPPLVESRVNLQGADDGSGAENSAAHKTTNKKTGRNDPCPCGATKSDGRPVKFKHCHGR
ncbi:MAG: preprotein translocase, SecA subunit [Candidatus Berkelbacteria bacterium Licking1014_2]|uniref:Protein translocase subunit SecA n=1 Tax=Candidatus Berkelbacteria bacterium Licking1014_2 TaxID=2017146 RepID=A0A554LUP6_9BACT|nr:MAG: preprotein translocase, SecA subunit [Candidatus Berkelbacteria bacterium Licking1014_2]